METYCNPLPIPSYPRGKYTFPPHDRASAWGWLQDAPRDFRELADPTVLWHEGRWYLFPSCGMAWVSEDFVRWTHHPIAPFDAGYAPTVARHRDRFLLTASRAGLWEAPHPLGPWREIGPMKTPSGEAPENWQDPMIFADDDGRLFVYWGIAAPGLFGAELDPERPEQMLTRPKVLFSFDPAHRWERAGDHNESAYRNFNEGAWMIKIEGTYYLTYAGPGTEWKTYGMGCYRGKSPLGPFVYDESSPFCTKTDGLVQGPGHGCVVRGPGETLWAFYTCRVCYEHVFERRIGMDRVRVHADGRLEVKVTETPQPAPGLGCDPAGGDDAGWLPLSYRRRATASSAAAGRVPLYAVDQSMVTWWQPTDEDLAPWLEVDLGPARFRVHALRLIWKDVGLDYDTGALPGPFRWRLQTKDAAGAEWRTVLDAADNQEDLLIDYRELAESVTALSVRLRLVGWPGGIRPGLVDFAVFGTAIANAS